MDARADSSDQKAQIKHGYLYALRLLAAAKRSSKEIAARLGKKGYPPLVTQKVLEDLARSRILDDQRLTREMVESAVTVKRLGRRRIAFEMRRKGIQPSAVDDALAAYSPEEERLLAQTLGQERWSKLAKVDWTKRRKRVYDYLAARGFNYELCRAVVSELKDEQAHEVL